MLLPDDGKMLWTCIGGQNSQVSPLWKSVCYFQCWLCCIGTKQLDWKSCVIHNSEACEWLCFISKALSLPYNIWQEKGLLLYYFCCITISSCESLMGREIKRRLTLNPIMPLADTEWRVKGACHPCCLSEIFMHLFLFGSPHSSLERSETGFLIVVLVLLLCITS